MNGSRPGWDDIWMRIALTMSERSKCPSGVGAVITDSKQRVVATGYTGPPQTFRHPDGGEWVCTRHCPRQLNRDSGVSPVPDLSCPTAHAEMNAVSFADRSRMEGGTFYISAVPCPSCTKMIANTGVSRVLWIASKADTYRGSEEQITYLHERCAILVLVYPEDQFR